MALSAPPFRLHLPTSRFIPSASPSPLRTALAQIRIQSLIHFNSSKTAISSADSRSFRLAVSSSVSDTEIQTEEHAEQDFTSNTKKKQKKKKKPKPSFYKQTRQRWSVKIASTRTKFPWEETEPQSSESLPGILLSSASATADSSTISAGEPSSGQESRGFRGHNRMISAPWAHGPKLRNSHLSFGNRGLVDESVDGRAVKSAESQEEAEKVPSSRGEKTGPQVESELEIHDATERIGGVGMGGDMISTPWMHGPKLGKSHLNSAVEDTALFHEAVHEGVDIEEVKNPIVIGKAEETPKLTGIHLESEAEMHDATGRNGGVVVEGLSVCGKAEKSAVGIIVEKLKHLDMDVDWKERDSEPNNNDAESPSWNSRNLDNLGGIVDSSVHSGPGPLHDSTEEWRSNGYKNSVVIGNRGSIHLPWERERSPDGEGWGRSNADLAEKTIPEHELHRLRNVSLRMKERMKVGAAGVTQVVIDEILNKWKKEEVVKIKFEGPPAVNMKRTHKILEHILPPSERVTIDVKARELSVADSISAFGWEPDKLVDINFINSLLDELGPRFQDWSGYDPIPVDADLLPGVVPDYAPPYRFLPYGMRHCLHNRQMTTLRRLARRVPPHFALGRNREHQGLAMAMVKLWEKSAIAKIAIKRGVPNTCNDRMAEELKKLTGGTLISRNKEYIVFYRGNDFLSPAVKEALVERKKLARLRQDEEEQARLEASALIASSANTASGPFVAGTLAETLAANARWVNEPSSEEREKMTRDAALAKHASLVRYLEKKLMHAKAKVKKAEKALRKVQQSLDPANLPTDLEIVTDEERFLFRKMGLSMRSFLLLGRRGVFDGTVENMHLHWKYRELVKILVKGKSFQQVKHVAISLEAESGGVLISLDKTTKGYAIIVYRGKNYQRPQPMRPKNLLTRRQALARSIELQRREALLHHISDLQERIEILKSELEKMETAKDSGDDVLYSQVDEACSSEDEIEDEGEEAYLPTYNDSDDDDDEQGSEIDEPAHEREPI
ncbi:hypothetical protein ACLOJK_022279 [Asimina triloba]